MIIEGYFQLQHCSLSLQSVAEASFLKRSIALLVLHEVLDKRRLRNSFVATGFA